MNCGGGVGGYIASRDEERFVREYNGFLVSITGTAKPGQFGFGLASSHQTSYGMRELGKDWTGNSVYLWAIANAVYLALLGPAGYARGRRDDPAALRLRGAAAGGLAGREGAVRAASSRSSSSTSPAPAGRWRPINQALRAHSIFGGKDLSAEFPEWGQSSALLRDRDPRPGRHRPARRRPWRRLCDDQAARVPRRLLGRAAGHGDGPARPSRHVFPTIEPGIAEAVGTAADLIPAAMRRADPPALPELSEPEVQRHYLRLSQETQGMMDISLFGTCTMKYHPPRGRAGGPALARRAAPAPARGHAAGRAGGRPRLRPDPARAVRHGPVRLPGRRRGRRRLHPRLRHPRLSRRPGASSSSATRSSPRSRPTPATPRRPPRPASRW